MDDRPPDTDQPLAELRRVGQHPPRELLDRVAALGPAAVPGLIEMATAEALHGAEQDSPEVWAPLHAIQLLGELGAAEAVEPLLPLLDQDDDWLGPALAEAFGRIGRPALAPARGYLFDRARTIWARARAAAALTQIAQRHPELRREVVAALVARLEPAETRTPEDETLNAFVVSELLDLEAVEAEPAIVRAYREDRVDNRVVRLGDVQRALGLPPTPDAARDGGGGGMRLWLRCTACGYEREHAVGTVYYDEGTVERRERGEETPYSEYVLTRRITCPKCGAVDRYELTSDALLALTAAMMELALRPGRRASDDPGDERIALIRFTVADGREMHPHAAREMYRAEVEREPTRADLRVRYGNVLRFLGHRDEAVRQYEAALQIDPAEVEACLNLAILARDGGDERSARRFLARVLELVPTSRLSGRQREEYRDFAHQALAELDGVAPSEPWRVGPGLLQSPDPASRAAITGPQPLVRATPKIGRNDPCPCGSGKKYKKCCGR